MADIDLHAPLAAHGILDSRLDALAAAGGPVAVRVLPPATQLNLRVDIGHAPLDALRSVLGVDLPGALSAEADENGRSVVWLGPDEWLVVDPAAPAGLEDDLRAALACAGAVTDQSGQRVSFEISGDVAGLLAKGTAIDLHPAAFPAGSAVQTLLAQAVVIVVARSDDASRVELIARSSFAPYVLDWLVDALSDPLAHPAPHAWTAAHGG